MRLVLSSSLPIPLDYQDDRWSTDKGPYPKDREQPAIANAIDGRVRHEYANTRKDVATAVV